LNVFIFGIKINRKKFINKKKKKKKKKKKRKRRGRRSRISRSEEDNLRENL
jgi:hypothetical protein